MKTYFVCYADDKYKQQQKALLDEALGFDYKIPYTFDYLVSTGFYYKNKKAFESLPNAGCVWKPFILLDSFVDASDGDLIVYSDCGDSIRPGYLDFILRNLKEGVLFVEGNFININYTKGMCFELMECIASLYKESKQLEAGQIALVKSDKTKRFLEEWLYYCEDMDVLLDDPNISDNTELVRHSRDQSILTNLVLKHNLPKISIHKMLEVVSYNTRG